MAISLLTNSTLNHLANYSSAADDTTFLLVGTVTAIAYGLFAAKSIYDHFSASKEPTPTALESRLVEDETDFIPPPESAEPKPVSEKLSDPLNKEVLQNIRDARAEGKKVVLVIGRHDAEPLLPSQNGVVFVSLDAQRRSRPEPDPGRLHLEMEIDSKYDFSPLHGLFDKVIVDFSTMKFIDNWDTLKPLLHKSPHSTLITEIPSGIRGLRGNESQATHFENLRSPYYYIPERAFGDIRFREESKKNQLRQKQDYLKTLFGRVQILNDAPYPTRSKEDWGWRPPAGQGLRGNLFVMSNPL